LDIEGISSSVSAIASNVAGMKLDNFSARMQAQPDVCIGAPSD
jgi:hypothetical protein